MLCREIETLESEIERLQGISLCCCIWLPC